MVVTRMNLPQSWTDTGQMYLKTKICYAQRKVEAVPGVIGWPRKLACWQTDYTREVSDSLQKAITRVSLKVVVGSRKVIGSLRIVRFDLDRSSHRLRSSMNTLRHR